MPGFASKRCNDAPDSHAVRLERAAQPDRFTCYVKAVESSLFEELGGESALRKIVDHFVDRMFDDAMIGFFFRSADRQHIKDKEFEFAARHLGANVEYTGRAIDAAHRAHRIFEGQFMRRLKLLEETLISFKAPERVREHWLSHTRSLKGLLVQGPCNAPDVEAR